VSKLGEFLLTYRIEDKKWILYRHTSNVDLIKAVAVNLKSYTKSEISPEKKFSLLKKLKELAYYQERNPIMPLDAINHRINTLAYFMFGYKDIMEGKGRFLFSPLGNLFLKYIGEKDKLAKIFLTMLWAIQYPHPHGGTDNTFELFPFRLVFKLLDDPRLDKKLYAFEVEYLVVFTQSMDYEKYEELVEEILNLRSLPDEELILLFHEKHHVLVNAAHEWDVYYRKLFQNMGVFDVTLGDEICRLQHGKTETYRKITRNAVSISPRVYDYCLELLEHYSFDEKPLPLDDKERLEIDVIKEIYSFYPRILLQEIGELSEENDLSIELLQLPKLIEQYSNNNEEGEAYLFEDVLVEGFNLFYNVEAKKMGGAGKTDIECLFLTESKKFAVESKSTRNKLLNINAGRLAAHRRKMGGQYTIIITPRYVPAVKNDIMDTPNVIITASTFAEYLYNCINNDIRNIDFAEFDEIIQSNLGTDISRLISNHTIEKFSAVSK
jgi:hypothetical protein